MTESPYKLPDDWRWVKLEDAAKHERRSVDPRRYPKELFRLYSIPAYDDRMRPEAVEGAKIGSAKLLAEPGTRLFSRLNPRIPRAWIVEADESARRKLASTEFMPLRPHEETLNLT
jgi:type I restriction enzyme, S subunit